MSVPRIQSIYQPPSSSGGSNPNITVEKIITETTYYTKPTVEHITSANELVALADNPQVSKEVTSRVDQVFAELSLSRLEGQFPVKTLLVPSAENPWVKIPLEDRTLQIINNAIKESIDGGYLPIQVPSEQYLNIRGGANPTINDQLPISTEAFKTGENGSIFDITKEISTGTAQGTVYGVTIHPNSSIHTVDVVSQRFGLQKGVTAVMKKSPIIDPTSIWISLIADSKIAQYIYTGDTEITPEVEEKIQNIINLGGFNTTVDDYIFTGYTREEYYSLINEKKNAILTEYINNPNADAYVDAAISYLLSQLVEHGLSPAFPLEYGTFRAFDSAFFDPKKYGDLMPEINQEFLVQLIVFELLDGSLDNLYLKDMYFFDSNNPLGIDIEKSWALFAQIIFALAIAQRLFSFVHNDLHGGNILYSDVDENHYLYYKRRLPSGEFIYYRVPTYGKVFKIIDPGRSTSKVLSGDIIGTDSQSKAFRGDWDIYSRNNDLYRFASLFVYYNQLGYEIAYSSPVDRNTMNADYDSQTKLMDMISTILACDSDIPGQTENAFTRIEECNSNPLLLSPDFIQAIKDDNGITDDIDPRQFTELCNDYALSHYPYSLKNKCKNAVPEDNLDWFISKYRITLEEIPEDAIVYLI